MRRNQLGIALALGLCLPAARAAWAQSESGEGSTHGGAGDSAKPSEKENAKASAGSEGTEAKQCEDIGATIDFGVGKATLNPQAKKTLDGVANWLQEEPSRSVRVEGHADHTGNAQANEKLSEERASAAKQYLTQQGIEPSQLAAVGLGEGATKPNVEDRRAVEVRKCEAEAPTAEATPPAPEPTPPPPVVEETPPPPPPVVVEVPPAARPLGPASRVGVGAQVGGGVTGFTDKEARQVTDPGGQWEARLSVGTRLPIALEGAYVGTAQNLEVGGLNQQALVVGQGAEGDVRINVGTLKVQPYIFGGFGWTRYEVMQANGATAGIADVDNTLNVPMGAGLDFRVSQSLLLDLRGNWRWTFDDELLDGAYNGTGKTAKLHNWNASAHLGWEF